MKTHNNIYSKIASYENLLLAWQKTRKGKTKKSYVIEFEKNIKANLLGLRKEIISGEYIHRPLKTFILRDPKTRRIHKSDFRDRIVHHSLINVIEPIFDRSFIYDSCANRKGKGTNFAIKRFELFRRKITNNFTKEAFCLKADIKHYFQEVDLSILIGIIKRKITDKEIILLIEKILKNKANFPNEERERELFGKRNASRQFNISIFC